MVWIYYLLMLAVAAGGLFLSILGLPGIWLMIAGFGVYAWITGWNVYIGWASMGTLLGLAVTAEFVEFFAGAAGSKAAGGRKRAMVGSVVGALIGGIALSPVVPILGTIVGACAGAFIGAAALELYDRDFSHAMRVGYGAARGRLYGIVSKLAFGVIMLIIILFAALPV